MSVKDATDAQTRASHPKSSTWLSANAGSGKTRVLTDRVARLLLRGVNPQHILCLTYTKAAASEMQNRLFSRLGEWAMKADAALYQELLALGEGGDLDGQALVAARRLFARAIETPGGLKIQTIHSFCASLLRRFPLEAQVSPGFIELDDRSARLLQDEILEELADTLASATMLGLARVYSGEDFRKIAAEVISNREGFAKPTSAQDIRRLFGVASNETEESLCGSVFLGSEATLVKAIIPIVASGSTNDQKLAVELAKIDCNAPTLSTLAQLESIFLTGEKAKQPFSAKVGAMPTKDVRQEKMGDLQDPFDNWMRRVEATRMPRLAFVAAKKAEALHQFASVFLPEYESRKAARGWLDFDDLIKKALALLSDPSVAAWVLFRLDGGIDHVLVDEAQDTSPDQWKVIELLTAEFTSGEGRSSAERTLFVVGDKKQSIYSFQGADVASFDARQQFFIEKFTSAGKVFQNLPLEYSFRSAQAILNVVDHTFGTRFPQALGNKVSHIAIKDSMPGRVDLWPVIEPLKTDADTEWENPVDLVAQSHHAARLAGKVAQTIQSLLASGLRLPDGNTTRLAHPGDFLILVRKRSGIFPHLISACKKLGLPIAGADRLKLAGILAVKDLVALLAFLATPEDDLSLAVVLRSPLFGWTEDELFLLAVGRRGYLWESLRNHPDHPETIRVLSDLRDQADFLRPYDLIERVLTRHDGRRKLVQRLGHEAIDGIDALLAQALAYESKEVPSLTGFLIWFETDDIDVKRQIDTEEQLIRVMTVHGAKGLEAPIVILPETEDKKPSERNDIQKLENNFPVWRASASESPAPLLAAKALKDQRSSEENLRLLYVAMTRAKNWLIVAAAGECKTPNSWYRLIEGGMTSAGAVAQADQTLRYSNGVWPDGALGVTQNVTRSIGVLDGWANTYLGTVPRPPQPLSPSNLGGAKVLGGQTSDEETLQAKRRGTAIHALLETLPEYPPMQWPAISARLVPADLDFDDIYQEATQLLRDPNLAHVFVKNALVEVTVNCTVFGRPMIGTIDRLVVDKDRVLAIDFKSNAVVPTTAAQVPEGLLRQMGAYQEALTQIYPGLRIDVAILWSKTGDLMLLDNDMVRNAFARAAISGMSALDEPYADT